MPEYKAFTAEGPQDRREPEQQVAPPWAQAASHTANSAGVQLAAVPEAMTENDSEDATMHLMTLWERFMDDHRHRALAKLFKGIWLRRFVRLRHRRTFVKPGEQAGGALTIDSPLQHFFDARLILRPESVFKVSCDELLSVVAQELHQRRLGACVVEFADGRLEFFDCSDFNSLLATRLRVSALAKSRGAVGEDADDGIEWKATKSLLRKIANLPVKTPRGKGLDFEPFDTSLPLRELVDRLERQRRVPCFTAGQLRAVVTANDVLELCGGCVTKASKELLENMAARSILSKELNDFELDTTEDTPALEVMQKLLHSASRAVPVLAQPDAPTPGCRTSGRIRILAQFDLAALWTVFGYKDDSDQWWWESEDVASNIFRHSCVDFLAFGRKNSDGRDQAPVAKVSLDEKLSKVIGRACTSPFRHVVVYEETNDRQLRNPCCEISSHEFVQFLRGAGLLSQLEFNSSKPRPARFRRMFSSHAGITSDAMSKDSSLSPAVQKDVPGPAGTAVSFNNMVEVEALVVPVCPVHHGKFMQYEALTELLATCLKP
ncbi:unnamed protein product [Symbiodinium natans]|uniref:Uncharacterized protein n=1 Tax=Symbiodinium natans TaxID=878477 RepID=A0A812N387_9DINO|nr:unnamed protein product [Symbiodinium natans]